jgi:hypothetical protein
MKTINTLDGQNAELLNVKTDDLCKQPLWFKDLKTEADPAEATY